MNAMDKLRQYNAYLSKINALYHEWAKKHGMSYNMMMTLYALDENDDWAQKQIAEEWLIPKQTVNTVVKDLERRGYLCCETRAHSKEKTVKLTPAGKAFAKECMQGLYEAETRCLLALGEEQLEQYLHNLYMIMTNFEAEVRKNE